MASLEQRAAEEHKNRDSIHAAGQRNLPWTRVSNRWEKRASWNKDHFLNLTVAWRWSTEKRERKWHWGEFYRRLKHPRATPMKTCTKGAHIKRNLCFFLLFCVVSFHILWTKALQACCSLSWCMSTSLCTPLPEIKKKSLFFLPCVCRIPIV